MALKDVKAKIAATNRTHKVTRAMEAVSAAKMRKTQRAAIAGRPYARAAVSILSRFAGKAMQQHPLTTHHDDNKKIALVVITSDKGLAGTLNSTVLKRAMQALDGRAPEDVSIYAYGKKGEEFFRRRGYTIAQAHRNASDEVPIELMEQLAHDLSDAFTEEAFGKVITVYSHFVSTFDQQPTMRRLLPLSLGALREIVEGITPESGMWGDHETLQAPASYSTESTEENLIDGVAPRLLAAALYHMMLEAKASEHSARMVAMKNASDKSKEIARDLNRHANRLRQAAITREVSEIISGREALAG